MKIIIIGAGELGQMLAERLSAAENDVVLIDASQDEFDRIHKRLDIMTLRGEATDVSILKQAGVSDADMLLAVSGDTTSNIISCRIARQLGVKRTVCRLYSSEMISDDDGLSHAFYGIDVPFSSQEECTRHIGYALRHQIVMEHLDFTNRDAAVVMVRIPKFSPLKGCKLMDIPDLELLGNIRFAALIRDHEFKVPHGDTTINENDLVYVAGARKYIQRFVECAANPEEKKTKSIVIGGATRQSELLIHLCLKEGMKVTLIDSDDAKCDHYASILPGEVTIIRGSSTDEDTLTQAHAHSCDTYVCAEDDDENGILSCILAKRLGAAKVVCITHKSEYMGIIPAIDMIDCGFNSTVESVNAVFRLMGEKIYRIDSYLKMYQAYLSEFRVDDNARIVGKAIKNCNFPPSVILAMIFRGDAVIAPTGSTEIQRGDILVAIVTPAVEDQLKRCLR